jgi:hypothetical protein
MLQNIQTFLIFISEVGELFDESLGEVIVTMENNITSTTPIMDRSSTKLEIADSIGNNEYDNETDVYDDAHLPQQFPFDVHEFLTGRLLGENNALSFFN